MTHEEAIDYIKEWREDYSVNAKDREVLALAIKALEQTDVLDKIREEVEALPNANPSYIHTCDVVDRVDVLDIIDKYKAGSEDEE